MNNPGTVYASVVVEGERACFRRPEFTTDLVSYDVLPPYVAEQMLRTLYDPVVTRWSIDRIYVSKPIRFILDEVPSDRGNRRTLLLTDVKYVIDAHIECSPEELSSVTAGVVDLLSVPRDVYLGAVCYPAKLRRADEADLQRHVFNPQLIDLGWMVKQQRSKDTRYPVFFRARLIDGCMQLEEKVLTAS